MQENTRTNELSCPLGALELCAPEFLQSLQIFPLPRDAECYDNATTTNLSSAKNDNLENISQMFEFDADMPESLHFDIPQPLDIGNVMSNDDLSANPIMAPGSSLTTVYDDDCLSSVPSYNSPRSFCAPGFMNQGSSSMFNSGGLLGLDMHRNDVDFQGDNSGIFGGESIPRFFGPTDYQKIIGKEVSHMVGRPASSCITSEISNMDGSSTKLGKLSVEQRKEKIHKYMKKKNKRNFSKKIKYACRKTLADSRPRVRGRFAKNDDFGENSHGGGGNYEEDDEEEYVGSNSLRRFLSKLIPYSIKEQVQKNGGKRMVEPRDVFEQISGFNTFNRSCHIPSWIQ